MIIFLITTFVVVIPILIATFLIFQSFYKQCIKNCILLNFSQFKSFYIVNPSKWDLDWTSCTIRYQKGSNCDYYKIAIKSYLEYLFLFKPFKKNINKKILQERNNEQLKVVLQDIQSDIDSLKKQAQEELQQVANTYVLLAENIYYNKNDKGLYAKDIATDKFYPVAKPMKMEE